MTSRGGFVGFTVPPCNAPFLLLGSGDDAGLGTGGQAVTNAFALTSMDGYGEATGVAPVEKAGTQSLKVATECTEPLVMMNRTSGPAGGIGAADRVCGGVQSD